MAAEMTYRVAHVTLEGGAVNGDMETGALLIVGYLLAMPQCGGNI
jgi:hypothetical protein